MEEAKTTESAKTSNVRTHKGWPWLAAAIVVLLLLLLWWWAAANYHWWPFKATTVTTGTGQTTTGTSSQSTKSSTGSNGATGSSGSTGSNGTSNTTTNPATTPPILSFSTGINIGDTMDKVSAEANGLTTSCTVTVNSTVLGKQEICAYSDGSKIVTVTYLNNNVVTVSRSGF